MQALRMNLAFFLLVAGSLSAIHSALAQAVYGNCASLTLQDLEGFGADDGLINEIVNANVTITQWESYCLSSGTVRNTYRSATARVVYTDDARNVETRLFSFVCDENNQWIPNPNATPTMTDEGGRSPAFRCSFCTTVEPTNLGGDLDYSPTLGCISKFEGRAE